VSTPLRSCGVFSPTPAHAYFSHGTVGYLPPRFGKESPLLKVQLRPPAWSPLSFTPTTFHLARFQPSLGPQSCRVSCAARSRRATRPCTGQNCPSRCLGLTHPHGTAKFCGRVLARHDPRCQPPLSVQQSRRELQPLTTNERSGHRMSRPAAPRVLQHDIYIPKWNCRPIARSTNFSPLVVVACNDRGVTDETRGCTQYTKCDTLLNN